jgi:hypothetical protein
MTNAFALLVQQRPMTAEEIADERKSAELAAHSPQTAKYMPGAPMGVRNKHAWSDRSVKAIKTWETKQARRVRERKRLPDLARSSEDITKYAKWRKRVYD